MILNQAKSSAIAKALSELNNVGGKFRGTVNLDKYLYVSCWSDGSFAVNVAKGDASEIEEYADQNAFYEAYGLN